MSLSRSNNKSKRKSTFRHSSAAQKRNRRSSKARNKPQKKKFTVMVKEGKKQVPQHDHDPRSVQKSQNTGHKGGRGRSLVNTTPIKDFAPEIEVNHHDIHCHTISEPFRTFVTEQQVTGVVKVDCINSQIKKSTKHTNQTSQDAKSCPKIPVQEETSKAENKIMEMPKKFDTHMARYNMAVQLYKYAIEQPDLTLSGTSK
ncbi:Uncharacterized protein Fot_06791 [Forsythia ovata]|uniref:Uncharacterized protein n=1 Tax=Forsythia ovata TaxID=205694 RepID=A0ABD1WUA3_9LAMI